MSIDNSSSEKNLSKNMLNQRGGKIIEKRTDQGVYDEGDEKFFLEVN